MIVPVELTRVEQSNIFSMPDGYTTQQVISLKDNEKVLELWDFDIIDSKQINIKNATYNSKISAWI